VQVLSASAGYLIVSARDDQMVRNLQHGGGLSGVLPGRERTSIASTYLEGLDRVLVDILAFVVEWNGGAAEPVALKVFQIDVGDDDLFEIERPFRRNAVAGKWEVRRRNDTCLTGRFPTVLVMATKT
jgi:hypothetical protein